MEHFLNEMWRQYRMRVFVMSAWKNEKGEVLFGMYVHLPIDVDLSSQNIHAGMMIMRP
jgi:hypothetical protein